MNSPSNVSDCSALSGPNIHDDICCLYTEEDSTNPNKICHSIPYTARTNIKYDYFDTHLYSVKCDDTQLEQKHKISTVLARCGEDESNPDQKKCQKYSSYVDSCCYWNGQDLIEGGEPYPSSGRGCYWLGAKPDGNIVWGSMKLKCSSIFFIYASSIYSFHPLAPQLLKRS